LNATIGILLALQERERSGKGQSIDVALYDCAISVLHPYASNYLYSGRPPRRSGNAHPNIAPYDSFRTATVPIFLAVGNDRQFRKLVAFLGKPGLANDARFLTNADRVAERDALKSELEALLAAQDGAKFADDLIRAGVPCGAVNSIDQVLAHPHTRHREMVVEIDDYRGTSAPIKMSRSRASYRRKPPKLGQHDQEWFDGLPRPAKS
jgi:crotonobetainyl-CoA:carnitine CoA-transferase CaiB-like acyl-CoA transferase